MSKQPSRLVALLLVAAFVTFFDRSLLPPIFGPVSSGLGVDREAIGGALTAYMFAYGFSQLGWGILLARWGRTKVLTVALVGCVVGAALTTLAPDYWTFVVGRVISGTCFGALIPVALVYFGDTLPLHERGKANANIAAALSLGLAVATIASPVLTEWMSWQVGFAIVVALSIGVLVGVRSDRSALPVVRVGVVESLRRVVRNAWALLALALMLLEGAILVGVVSFLPAALEFTGTTPAEAGLAVGVFGLAVIGWSFVVKRLIPVLAPHWLLGLGGGAAVVAFALLIAVIAVWSVVIAALLLGFAWAAAHTQLQTWMSDAVHDARAIGMSLLGVMMFVGAGMGSGVATVLDSVGNFEALFIGATWVALVFTVVAFFGRRAYRQHGHNVAAPVQAD